MAKRSVLDNGIRVFTEEIPRLSSVTLGIWVENGSRYETARESGLSHFLEHLIFKGTKNRSALRIAEEIEAVGGLMNAVTGKESTGYYVKVLDEHLDLAFDVLADIFLHSTFDPEEIDRERTVVLQEISQTEDDPEEHLEELFYERYWGDHALGRPICGTRETVSAFRRDDVVTFFRERYRPNHTLVVAAGNVRHEDLVERCARAFGGLRGVVERPPEPPPAFRRGVFAFPKKLEQAHAFLATPGLPHGASERYTAALLCTVLGGGMSSRLFQEIREKRGLAYATWASPASFHDVGFIGAYAATSRDRVREAVDVMFRELEKLAATGLTDEELERGKNQIKGSLLLGLETSDNQMFRVARDAMCFGEDEPVAETIRRIEAVTSGDVTEIARRLFRPADAALALYGDLPEDRPFEDLLPG